MKRAFDPNEPERMDLPQPVTPELERDLANLVSLNRWFGSHRLITRFLALWLRPKRAYRILDLATGAGDIPRLMVDWARERDISLEVDAVDASESTLDIARRAGSGYPEITWTRADALQFDGGRTYDLVCCSLALHHFSDDDAVRLLRRCSELSHRWVIASDLERNWATTAGVWFLTEFIYSDPMTRYDGRLSARRAFSFAEMRTLGETAGWKSFGHARFLFCRQALWLDSRDLGATPIPVLPVSTTLPCPT